MKKTCNFFLAVIMSVMALFAGFVTFAGENKTQVSALHPDYSPLSRNIYYFYDYYPTMGYSELSSYFLGYDFFYDYKNVDGQSFSNMVNSNYFEGFESDTLVIIDLKLIEPDDITMNNFFNCLLSQNCKVIFVSPFISNYTNLNDQVLYLEDNFEDLKTMVHMFAAGSIGNPELTRDTYYLLDKNMVEMGDLIEGDIVNIYNNNFIVRLLLNELLGFEPVGEEIRDHVNNLCADRNIKILVHTLETDFIDILTGDMHTISDASFFEFYNEYSGNIEYYDVYAMGFWYLDFKFNEFLAQLQGYPIELPIYIIEREPIENTPSALKIKTIYNQPYSKAKELLYLIEQLM